MIEARPDEVWAALRDWGALHRRLAPGFVTDTRLDGEDRIVTFAGGLVVREVLVALDDERRRLVWTVVDGPYSHHNGAAQVHAEGSGSRFVWTADLLPDERARGDGAGDGGRPAHDQAHAGGSRTGMTAASDGVAYVDPRKARVRSRSSGVTPKTCALNSPTPAARIPSIRSVTVCSSPMIATSAGPSAPSRSSMPR